MMAHQVRGRIMGAPYYGGFLRDPEGHKIEAMYWDEEMAAELKIAF